VKWSKRLLSLLLAVALLAASGCSYSLSEKGDKSSNPSEMKTLRIWGGVPPDAGPSRMADEFNKEYKDKGISVEYNYFVNNQAGNQRMETILLSGDNIDAYFTYTTSLLEKRSMSNMALDLTPFINRDHIDMSGYFGGSVNSYYVNGKPYSIPTKLDQYGITINKDKFDEAGIPIPKEWTYQEFREIAKKLSKGTGKDRTYGMFFCTQQDITYPITYILPRSLGGDALYKNGGKSTNFDSPVVYDMVSLVNDMMNVDHSAPTHIESVTQKLTQESMFLTGKCAMTIGPWIIRSVKDQKTYPHTFTTAFVPYPVENKNSKNYTQGGLGDFLSISPNTRYPSETWEFLKWYATKGMIYMVEGGRIPAYKEFDTQTVTNLLLKGGENLIDAETAKNVLILPKSNYAIPSINTNLSEINEILADEFEQIYTGQKSVKQGLADAKSRGDQILRTE